jgi:hypothetical protein
MDTNTQNKCPSAALADKTAVRVPSMSSLSHSDLNSLVNPTGTSLGTGAASLLDWKFELKLKNF